MLLEDNLFLSLPNLWIWTGFVHSFINFGFMRRALRYIRHAGEKRAVIYDGLYMWEKYQGLTGNIYLPYCPPFFSICFFFFPFCSICLLALLFEHRAFTLDSSRDVSEISVVRCKSGLDLHQDMFYFCLTKNYGEMRILLTVHCIKRW